MNSLFGYMNCLKIQRKSEIGYQGKTAGGISNPKLHQTPEQDTVNHMHNSTPYSHAYSLVPPFLSIPCSHIACGNEGKCF
jgi:hypothetical protein